jgi:hypothetical protein
MPSATDTPAQPVATKDAPKEKKVSLKKSTKEEAKAWRRTKERIENERRKKRYSARKLEEKVMHVPHPETSHEPAPYLPYIAAGAMFAALVAALKFR